MFKLCRNGSEAGDIEIFPFFQMVFPSEKISLSICQGNISVWMEGKEANEWHDWDVADWGGVLLRFFELRFSLSTYDR